MPAGTTWPNKYGHNVWVRRKADLQPSFVRGIGGPLQHWMPVGHKDGTYDIVRGPGFEGRRFILSAFNSVWRSNQRALAAAVRRLVAKYNVGTKADVRRSKTVGQGLAHGTRAAYAGRVSGLGTVYNNVPVASAEFMADLNATVGAVFTKMAREIPPMAVNIHNMQKKTSAGDADYRWGKYESIQPGYRGPIGVDDIGVWMSLPFHRFIMKGRGESSPYMAELRVYPASPKAAVQEFGLRGDFRK